MLAVVVASLWGLSSTVSAHSGLAAASPGPGATVGGDVSVVQLFYADFITTFDATVTSPSGDVLSATPEMLSDIEASISLDEPLTETGEYAVRHTITSIDGDVVEAAYLFSYDPAAAPPTLLFVDPDDGGGPSPVVIAVAVVGVLVIAVLAWRLVRSVQRRREIVESTTGPSGA